jgi:hypothetical protein
VQLHQVLGSEESRQVSEKDYGRGLRVLAQFHNAAIRGRQREIGRDLSHTRHAQSFVCHDLIKALLR